MGEKSKADLRAESFHDSLIGEQAIIDSQVKKLVSIQRDRGMNINNCIDDDDRRGRNKETVDDENNDQQKSIASQKKTLEEKSAKVEIDILKLKTERDNREKRAQEIALEESKQRIRASEASNLKKAVEESKTTTIDELTRGVVNYKKLGLDFTQTGRDSQLQFLFTELDPSDPSRKFAFVLFVNDDEKYDIIDCDPIIDGKILKDILEELNEKEREDMSLLVRRMRRAFKGLCEK